MKETAREKMDILIIIIERFCIINIFLLFDNICNDLIADRLKDNQSLPHSYGLITMTT